MILKSLITLGICIAAAVALALSIHILDNALGTERSPALEVTFDPDHGVLCWANTHHAGLSCLPEWMLIPSRYDSISNISSANIENQPNGQKDPTPP